jgi:hypothetical protein
MNVDEIEAFKFLCLYRDAIWDARSESLPFSKRN